MNTIKKKSEERQLATIYEKRFAGKNKYRQSVWREIIHEYLVVKIGKIESILDLGCGYGEFINNYPCNRKYGMDLNPDAKKHLNKNVVFYHHDCSKPWPIRQSSLDAIFSSNFFEHLPDKIALYKTLDHAYKCLKKDGILVALGPNIRVEPGNYWNYIDHYIPLSDISLSELLITKKFGIIKKYSRFLPWTMSGNWQPPTFLIKFYLKNPVLWSLFGRQFLILAKK